MFFVYLSIKIYNLFMISREQVKILLVKENMSITELARKMTAFTGKSYTQQGLSNKLSRDTLRYSEISIIAEILGYKINFEKIK
jgi:hypothetical protein